MPKRLAISLVAGLALAIFAQTLRCETGRFQEMMKVELVNEGPVTILLDSAKSF